MPHSKFLQLSEDCKAFTEKSMDFQRKIIERSGLGDETYLPEGRGVLCNPLACLAQHPAAA